MRSFALVVCTCLVLCGCARALTRASAEDSFAPPPLDRVVRVFDTTQQREIDLPTLLDRLAKYDAVFLGETHLDETTHRVEDAVYAGLVERRRRVVLALEMFSRDVQETLDAYIAGELSEPEFLSRARPWPNYRTGYRALVERARREGLPVVGSNAPRSVTRKVAFAGRDGFEALSEEERSFLAPTLLPNSPAYWERFERVVRGHAGIMIGDEESRLYSTQSLWDNTMGYSCAEALARHPDHIVLHVNGGFHSAYRQGTAEQFQQRAADARMATVSIVTSFDLAGAKVDIDDREVADFVVVAEERARGIQDGSEAVTVARELRYELRLPKAARERAVPLLVYLPEEGIRTVDASRYWRLAVGDEAAVAVVEMPYPQREDQLHLSGRWFWAETFREDLGALRIGIERTVRHLGRHYAIDPERIVLVGRGAGATAVVSTALYTSRLGARMLAFEPERFTKLREGALPGDAPAVRSLEVFVDEADRDWWQSETEEYRGIGLDMKMSDADSAVISRVRRALGLPAASPETADTVAVVVRDASPLAVHWARLYADAAREGKPYDIVPLAGVTPETAAAESTLWMTLEGEPKAGAAKTGFAVDEFADAEALPLAPGPFGGTTVVVLPPGISEESKTAWQELEEQDVLKKRSRFARLQVASMAGEPGLAEVLQGIRDAGRSNVLVVPAVFCATADEMRAIRDAAGSLDRLTVAWLPGLGGRVFLRAD